MKTQLSFSKAVRKMDCLITNRMSGFNIRTNSSEVRNRRKDRLSPAMIEGKIRNTHQKVLNKLYLKAR